MPEWEDVCSRDGNYLDRIRVPGGWLYRTTLATYGENQVAVALAFVPMSEVHEDVRSDRGG